MFDKYIGKVILSIGPNPVDTDGIVFIFTDGTKLSLEAVPCAYSEGLFCSNYMKPMA